MFKFHLPEAHPNSSFGQVTGTGGGSSFRSLLNRQYKRFGAMAAFDSFQQFQDHFLDFIDLFRTRPLDEDARADIDLIEGLHVGSPPLQQPPFNPPAFTGKRNF